ncbi:MAG: hypothetical protein ABW321_30025 [Polyangiales bacterium]
MMPSSKPWKNVSAKAARTFAALVVCTLALRIGSVVAQTPPTAASFELAASLEHAAFRVPGAPSVIVHAPARFDPHKPLQLVVFLHGYSGCVAVLMGRGETRCKPRDGKTHPGWDLGRVHDAAGTNTLFIVPQLAYMKRDGDPGAFGRAGGFRAFLEELLRGPLAPKLGAARTLADVARIDLFAHSGAYRAALAIVEQGGLPDRLLRSVVLLDALYGETPRFAAYVERRVPEGLHFVAIGLGQGTPAREGRGLMASLRKRLPASQLAEVEAAGIADAVARHAVVIASGTPPHRLVPETHLAEVLAALHRSPAPP